MKLFTVGAVFFLSLAIGSRGDDGIGFAMSRVKNIFGSQIGDTPISTPDECARTCVEGEPPKTCYFPFVVEYYSTMTRACSLCRQTADSRVTPDCQCIEGDGYEKSGLIVVNRMYPGPGVMVCQNDNVVVDVQNLVTGNAITVHWHGIYQKNYQYSDGAPFVTQCPIQEGSTFRYQWKAENSGTHLWHAHTGLHKGEGLMGPLIIREPKSTEPNSHLWDLDNINNVIFLTDLFHRSSADHFPGNFNREPGQEPDNFLINGMGQWTDPDTGETTNSSYARFEVEAGKRYRFRLINGCGLTCPVQMTIQGHRVKIIASDGQPLEPFEVNSIVSFAAERYDFVLNADQKPGNYWIQLRAQGPCINRKMQQFAVLHYKSAPEPLTRSCLSFDGGLHAGVVLNPLNVHCFEEKDKTNVRCLSEQSNANAVPLPILKKKADVQIFMNFGFNVYNPWDLFQPGRYLKYHVAGASESVAMMGNISHSYPASPLLSQRGDIPNNKICSIADKDKKCSDSSEPCECVHIEKIPLNSVVEIILVDEAQVVNLSHPFHLHGQPFYLFGEGNADLHGVKRISVDIVKRLENQGKLNRHRMTSKDEDHNDVSNPTPEKVPPKLPAKDTFAVPNNGYSIIRFFAQNPGYWLFHCHFEIHAVMGMMTIFHVGEPTDLPPIPQGFPKCGPYTPPLIF